MKDVMLKLEFVLMWVDLKVLLLAWILIDLYRNTMLIADFNGHPTVPVAEVMAFVWGNAGSPYLIWIPIVAILDVVIKNVLRKIV